MNSTHPQIYVDEAGNTGSNILNKDQKYFVLSAVSFTKEELDLIKNKINYSKELHFVKMKKSNEGRQIIKALLQHPLMDKNHITYEFVDKDFCTYAQITDMLIEPVVYYVIGEDLYKKKGNIITANLLYIFAEHHDFPEFVVDFKKAFEKMIRKQTPESITEFYETVNILEMQTENEEFIFLLSLIKKSYYILEDILIEDKKYSLDTTIASLLVLVEHWYKKFDQKVDVITDHSKQIQAKEELINKLINIKEEKIVGYDTRKSIYPVPINTLTMVNSANNFGIQLADLVASAVAFRWNETDKFKAFQDDIKDLPFFNIPCYPIRPATAEELLQPVDDSKDSEPFLTFLLRNVPFES